MTVFTPLWRYLVFVALLLAIFWRLGAIEGEVRQNTRATCLQSDYLGVDSLSTADREACA